MASQRCVSRASSAGPPAAAASECLSVPFWPRTAAAHRRRPPGAGPAGGL